MSDKHIEPTASVIEVFKALKGEARTKALQSRAGKLFYASATLEEEPEKAAAEINEDEGAFAPPEIQ